MTQLVTASRLIVPGILVALTSFGSPAWPQDAAPVHERRVLVWKGGPNQVFELAEGLGHRGFLGVGLLDLTSELRGFFGAPQDRGVLISEVVEDSPAMRAGLRVGDVLTAVDGRPVGGVIGLQLAIAKGRDGDEVELDCLRDGEKVVLQAVLEVQDRSQFDISPIVGHHHSMAPKVALELSAESATDLDIDPAWVEGMVGSVGRRLADSTVLEQLEAMRVERQGLQDTLEQMEERLQQLEAELAALADNDR